MAESSITHNFVISDPEAVERFVNALEQSALDPRPKSDAPYLELKGGNRSPYEKVENKSQPLTIML